VTTLYSLLSILYELENIILRNASIQSRAGHILQIDTMFGCDFGDDGGDEAQITRL
jgi:hypothetical protein